MDPFRTNSNCKRILLYVFFIPLFLMVCNASLQAQVIPDIQDLPIDPNALKNASPADLQNYLKDYNQQKQKAGLDIHKGVPELGKRILSRATALKKIVTAKEFQIPIRFSEVIFFKTTKY